MNRQSKKSERINANVGVNYTKKTGKNQQVSVGFKSVFSNKGKPKHYLTVSFKLKRLGLQLSYKL